MASENNCGWFHDGTDTNSVFAIRDHTRRPMMRSEFGWARFRAVISRAREKEATCLSERDRDNLKMALILAPGFFIMLVAAKSDEIGAIVIDARQVPTAWK